MHTGIWWGDVIERDHFEYQGIDGRIILELIFKKWNRKASTGLLCLRIGTYEGARECGNELSGSTKCVEILDYYRNC